jgi:hypothetical protein
MKHNRKLLTQDGQGPKALPHLSPFRVVNTYTLRTFFSTISYIGALLIYEGYIPPVLFNASSLLNFAMIQNQTTMAMYSVSKAGDNPFVTFHYMCAGMIFAMMLSIYLAVGVRSFTIFTSYLSPSATFSIIMMSHVFSSIFCHAAGPEIFAQSELPLKLQDAPLTKRLACSIQDGLCFGIATIFASNIGVEASIVYYR